jgi:putative solute:sodium symporter small subunit
MGAQGSLVIYVLIIAYYAHYMNKLDQEYDCAEVEED